VCEVRAQSISTSLTCGGSRERGLADQLDATLVRTALIDILSDDGSLAGYTDQCAYWHLLPLSKDSC